MTTSISEDGLDTHSPVQQYMPRLSLRKAKKVRYTARLLSRRLVAGNSESVQAQHTCRVWKMRLLAGACHCDCC